MHGRRSLKPQIFDLGQHSYSKAKHPIMNPQDQPNPMAQPNLANQPKLLKDYLNPSIGVELFDKPSCSHDIKPGIFQILPNFYGDINEDPYDHLQEFSKICATIKDADDALRLALFPFSLKGEASYLFSNLEITSWTKLFNDFITKFYPHGKTNMMRKMIMSFPHNGSEQLHESWSRYQSLLRKCPHHGFSRWQLVHYFYEGMDYQNKQIIDASCGGSIASKSEDQAYRIFEELSQNSFNYTTSSTYDRANVSFKKEGIYELVRHVDKELRDEVSEISKKLEKLLSAQTLNPSPKNSVCSFCSSHDHNEAQCVAFMNMQKEVNAFSQPNPHNPSWNPPIPSWKNHSNQAATFQPSRSNLNSQNLRIPHHQNFPNLHASQHPPHIQNPHSMPNSHSLPNFQNHQMPQQSSSQNPPILQNVPLGSHPHIDPSIQTLKEQLAGQQQALAQMMSQIQAQNQIIQNQGQLFQNQLSQLCKGLSQGQSAEENPRGQLPSQPIANPKHNPPSFNPLPNASMVHTQASSSQGPQMEEFKEILKLNQLKRVLPRLGNKEENGDSNEKKEKDKGKQKITLEEDSFSDKDESMKEKEESQWNESSNKLVDSTYDPPLSFPTAITPQLKPKQSLCNPKNETRTINLSAEVSAFISNTLPRKQKDPGSPLVSCSIGNLNFRKALLDLGASVNILLTHLFESLKLGNLKPTSIVLSLGDKLLRYPRGMIEDVIVEVEGCCFPADFLVLDITSPENVKDSTIILGRPFLATAEANIDCKTGIVVMSYGGKRVPLKIFNEIKGFEDIEEQGNIKECHTITIEHDPSEIPRISSQNHGISPLLPNPSPHLFRRVEVGNYELKMENERLKLNLKAIQEREKDMHDRVEQLTKENENLKIILRIHSYKRRKIKTTPKLNSGSRKIKDQAIRDGGNQKLQRKVWIPKSIMNEYRQTAAHAVWIPKSFLSF